MNASIDKLVFSAFNNHAKGPIRLDKNINELIPFSDFSFQIFEPSTSGQSCV